jgi:hypothetical protein
MKRSTAPESQILPELTWADMQPRLIERLRAQAVSIDPDHAWKGMSNEDLVRDAGLAQPHPTTGETTFTLAALLILGTNEAFRARYPLQGQGTQAVYRPGKWRRGERLDLRLNLLETHDQLMAFAAKHLPDALETTPKGETINLRDAIFSELFANSLMFRDYGKAFPARFVIEADRVFLENGMAPGKKPGQKFIPNPVLAHVFRQIGWGRKAAAKNSQVSHWGKAYFGILPMILEGSVYRILAPYPKKETTVPTISTSWDISEMLTTQAPWTHSRAAQSEVDATRNALNDLVESPLLDEVENMRIPAPIDARDERWSRATEARPEVAREAAHAQPTQAQPAPQRVPAVQATQVPREEPKRSFDPSVNKVTFATKNGTASGTTNVSAHAQPNGQANGHVPPIANGHVPAQAPARPDPTPTVAGAKPQAVAHSERIQKILEFCKTPRYRSELQAHVGIVNRDYFRKDILNPLIEKGLLEPTLPDKPNSPKQQYGTVGR